MLHQRRKTLHEERVKLVGQARALHDKASSEKRDLTSDERSQWERMMSEVDGLKRQIDEVSRQIDEEKLLDEEREDEDNEEREDEDNEEREDEDNEEEREGEDEDEGPDDERKKRFSQKLGKDFRRRPARGSGRVVARWPGESEASYRNRRRRATEEYRQAFRGYILFGESGLRGRHARAIQADSDILGGYMVAPIEFIAKLIKFVDDAVILRQKATKFTVAQAQSLGAPALDTDISDSDWTSELATGNEDTAMAFGKRELHPHPLAKRIKVSNKLLRASALTGGFSADNSVDGGGPEGLVRGRMGYKFAVTFEKAAMTGNGSQKPLGIYTASTRGISTSRDVTCGTTTNFTADGLMDVKYSLKGQYQAKAEWLVHRDGMKRIRQLKDGMGQYLWGPGLNGGDPDMLLDRPVNLSEFNPNTFTTGQYVIMFGDYSFYWIADAEQLVIQKLLELYAEANQTGFIGRLETDGMPVLEEAFARGKLA